jgi:hypothetical protein
MIFRTGLCSLIALAGLSAAPAAACSSCGCTVSSSGLSQDIGNQPETTIDLRYYFVPQTRLRAGRSAVDCGSIALATTHDIERNTDSRYRLATIGHLRECRLLAGADS